MNDHPYIATKQTQSKYQVENSTTGEVYMSCATEDIARTIVHLMAKAFQEGNKQGFEGGFNAGRDRVAKIVEDFGLDQESDLARRPSGASDHAKRVADRDRKLAGEGGAA